MKKMKFKPENWAGLKGYTKLTVAGFVVIGILQLQIIENQWKYGDSRVAENYQAGRRAVELEAIKLGLGRQKGPNFSWNTNLFDNIGTAIDAVVESEKRAEEMALLCMRAMKTTLDTAELMRSVHSNVVEENMVIELDIPKNIPTE